MRTVLLSIAGILAAPGLLLVPLSIGDSVQVLDTVTIDSGSDYFCDPSFAFAVCETTVDAGDTVTWTNSSGFHTVTECDAAFSECPPPGGFSSPGLTEDDTFSHTFAAPGTFPYYCEVHPEAMRGRIIALQVTPTPALTPSPTTVAQPTTGTPAVNLPANVPSTGGPAGGTAESVTMLLLIGGGIFVALAATVTVTARRG